LTKLQAQKKYSQMLFLQEAHQKAGDWHQAMEIIFSNQSLLCLDISFQQNCRQKNLQAKAFFCRQTLFFSVKRFFCRQTLFLQATLFIKKIADNENLSSYLSQGDGGLKKNNPYLIKLIRE
jgi:hypothetical protein